MRRSVLSIELLQPPANVLAKRRDRYAAIDGRKWTEAPQGRLQQGCSACRVSPLEMMKGRCDLNQRLQKSFLWLLSLQPNTFPVLVSEEKFLVPVASQTFRKRSATPIKLASFAHDRSASEHPSAASADAWLTSCLIPFS
jgi:hypothetical protein